MKYFAKIENEVVTNVVISEFEETLPEGTWIEYTLDGSLRTNPAGVGSLYNSEHDVFINPKPFDSWILDETTWQWKAPVDKPTDAYYSWDEDTTSWYKMKDFE